MEARKRADERSRRLVRAVRVASREVHNSDPANNSQGAHVGGFRPNRIGQLHATSHGMDQWKERAVTAEAHNERVGLLLRNYVLRNQIVLPTMPANISGAHLTSLTTRQLK